MVDPVVSPSKVIFLVCILTASVLSACFGGAAAPAAPAASEEAASAAAAEEPAVELPEEAPAQEEAPAPENAEPAQVQPLLAQAGTGRPVNRPGRLIIKDGQITLVVSDTDVALGRITQIISDLDGYIISSRVWREAVLGVDQKFGTLTVGVPVERFEAALVRLREIGSQVKDEQASGQDVSDEYVDLDSRLESLEATRERILSFLEKATTVEETLQVNAQLAEVEEDIAQVRGRMNYLFDRAAFSTITIQVEPEPPQLTPTPTATATATPTPTPSPTATPWRPGDTVRSASRTLVNSGQRLTEWLIQFVIVVVPCFMPIVLAAVGVWWYFRRRPRG